MNFVAPPNISTGWLKKVSNYHHSLLNRIKTRHYGYIFHQFRLQNKHKVNNKSVLNILCVT